MGIARDVTRRAQNPEVILQYAKQQNEQMIHVPDGMFRWEDDTLGNGIQSAVVLGLLFPFSGNV